MIRLTKKQTRMILTLIYQRLTALDGECEWNSSIAHRDYGVIDRLASILEKELEEIKKREDSKPEATHSIPTENTG